jgi:hypothetical protein
MNYPRTGPWHDLAHNVYSQFGEDGIVGELLRRLALGHQSDGWCVEFGAWDGLHLSNTCNLIKNHDYKAVLIEGDRKKYQSLCANFPQDSVYKLCEFIGFEGESTLDNILLRTPIPKDFDFLSIDIDGCDYYIFASLTHYRPKVVCIEYNPSIPNEVEFVQPRNFKVKQGASAKSLLSLAQAQGYALAGVTLCNLILVRNDLLPLLLPQQEYSLDDLRDDSSVKMFLFAGYDGSVLSNKPGLFLIWHDFSVPIADLQALPASLRVFSSDYSLMRKVAFAVFLWFKYNLDFIKTMRKRF